MAGHKLGCNHNDILKKHGHNSHFPAYLQDGKTFPNFMTIVAQNLDENQPSNRNEIIVIVAFIIYNIIIYESLPAHKSLPAYKSLPAHHDNKADPQHWQSSRYFREYRTFKNLNIVLCYTYTVK